MLSWEKIGDIETNAYTGNGVPCDLTSVTVKDMDACLKRKGLTRKLCYFVFLTIILVYSFAILTQCLKVAEIVFHSNLFLIRWAYNQFVSENQEIIVHFQASMGFLDA